MVDPIYPSSALFETCGVGESAEEVQSSDREEAKGKTIEVRRSVVGGKTCFKAAKPVTDMLGFV